MFKLVLQRGNEFLPGSQKSVCRFADYYREAKPIHSTATGERDGTRGGVSFKQ